ncbi:MAG: hypothetical protein DMG67_12240 [Acidobacteria bacterium]|nr:MAG: hypothetical protein DMG67_12240 [Acidobacteriota bacterium]
MTGSGSATLNVSTSSTTPAATSTLTITGASGSLSHSSAVSLVVNAAGGGATTNMMVTWYGVPDNSPPGKAIQFPTIHSEAGGTGTFADPITFATDTRLFAPGSIVYLPMVKKYFIMEDLCTNSGPGDQGPGCVNDFNNGIKHIDMWAGGDTTQSVITCEDNLTRTLILQPRPVSRLSCDDWLTCAAGLSEPPDPAARFSCLELPPASAPLHDEFFITSPLDSKNASGVL